jgi:peptide/nickel transport system substrate-binding protein
VTEAGDAFGQQPAGTGPYRVVEFRPDDALILEAHDAYWGGLPPAARIEFRVMPEPAARIAALVSGEVDLVNDVPPDQVATLATEEGVEVRGIPVGAMRILYYNTRHPVLADRRFRQGLNAAIDRELIIASLWNGQAVLPRGFQFPDFGNLYNADRPAPMFDPERARRLIQESGYDGQPVSLWFPVDTFTLDEAVTQAVVEMWREVGIDARPQSMTLAEHWENPDQKPAIHTSNGNEFADPESWWLRWGDESTVGRLFWTPDEPRFYELGHQARTTLDQQTRYAAYQQMLDIWEEEAPGTVLHIPTENYGVRREIGWQPYGFYYLDFRPDNLSF